MKGGKPLWTEFNENQLKNFLDKATSKKEFCLLLGYLSYQHSIKTQKLIGLDISKEEIIYGICGLKKKICKGYMPYNSKLY
jgi:uncharacterized protein (UPF0264 family)